MVLYLATGKPSPGLTRRQMVNRCWHTLHELSGERRPANPGRDMVCEEWGRRIGKAMREGNDRIDALCVDADS